MTGSEWDPAPVEAARLASRIASLRDALRLGGERITPRVAVRARAELDRVEARLRLGGDQMVVAFLGGTGSGKTSLFNAVAARELVEVGVRRPTTGRSAACVWGDGGEAALDVLGVDGVRRFRSADPELAGLVLLDVPDHDSVESWHAGIVDRTLPLVDLAVWVVDPQKYADEVLHARYLTALAHRADSMLVLLNQSDTLTPAARDRELADLRSRLDADGLPGVPVIATSALQGSGVGEVRSWLATALRDPGGLTRRAEAVVSELARLVVADLAPDPIVRRATGPERFSAVYRLARASGVEAVESELREIARNPRRRPELARPGAPAPTAAGGVRDAVVAAAGRGLPERWLADLERQVGTGEDLRSAVGSRLAEVEVPVLRAGGPRLRLVLAAMAVATFAVVLGIADLSGAAPALGLWPAVVAALAAVTAVAAAASARAGRVRDVGRQADEFAYASRAALMSAVNDVLNGPASRVVGEHLAARAAATRAARLPGDAGGDQREPDNARLAHSTARGVAA